VADEEQQIVRIEGVPFELHQAQKFAERTRIYVGANPEPMTPGTVLGGLGQAAGSEPLLRQG
jgi:hypothetical protein